MAELIPMCGAKHPNEDGITCTVPPEPNALSDAARAEFDPTTGVPEDPPYDVHVHQGRHPISGETHRWEDA